MCSYKATYPVADVGLGRGVDDLGEEALDESFERGEVATVGQGHAVAEQQQAALDRHQLLAAQQQLGGHQLQVATHLPNEMH